MKTHCTDVSLSLLCSTLVAIRRHITLSVVAFVAITATSNDNYEALSSGSSAEFYIKPRLSCVGDIVETVILTSRSHAVKQLDANTTDYL